MNKIYFIFLFVIFLCIFCQNKIEKFENYNNKSDFPIDVVYTWSGDAKTDDIRTSNNNELKYSVKSVLKYLPWVNHIYILMNPPKKKPDWINERLDKYITVIDHTETFPKSSDLPCTNSNAIETTLHYIPNLSEHFIYFNDDVFIGKPLDYTYFFTSDGKAMISNLSKDSEKMLIEGKENKLKIKLPETKRGFYNHVPISLLKSSIIDYQNEYPDYIKFIRSQKIRNDVCIDYNLTVTCQQQHYNIGIYMYKQNKAELKEYDIGSSCSKNGYINSYCLNYLDDILKNPPNTFCIQDTELDKNKRQYFYDKINEFFNKFFDEN